MEYKKEKSCGCIIIDDNNKVLLICGNKSNFWGFPKGHMEEGETEIETALREVKEEVGLDVKIDEEKRYTLNYLIEDKKVDKTTILYLAKPLSSNVIKQDAEVSDTKWCTFDETLELLSFPDWKEVFKKAIENL